jgi:hypothetical protein
VLVRLTRITGLDLNQFEFDYDLNFYVFLMNADGKVHGRYGGRDAASAEGRLSLSGLDHALKAALVAHAKDEGAAPARGKPLLVTDYPAAKRFGKNECIHCHQVNEFRREKEKADGTWDRNERWRYPLPENVGLTLDVDRGDRVKAVAGESPAAKVGVRAGDTVTKLNGFAVASIGDVMHALHRAPPKGEVPIVWTSDGKQREGRLALAEGWKRTNITWRPSLLDVLPSPTLFGDELTAEEKKALGLGAKRVAFRQDRVLADLRPSGLKEGDVVIGVDGQALEMTLRQFLAHVRTSYVSGDKVTLNVLREGKRLDLPLTLR